MRMSDIIASFIDEIIKTDGEAQLSRNELADKFNVVPSQINYVITSRFTPEQGYIVESRRGSGGYIKITRPAAENSMRIMHLINSIGSSIDETTTDVIINNLYDYSVISREAAVIMKSAVNNKALILLNSKDRNTLRANILKNMLINLVNE